MEECSFIWVRILWHMLMLDGYIIGLDLTKGLSSGSSLDIWIQVSKEYRLGSS